jgi:hypothetical protein
MIMAIWPTQRQDFHDHGRLPLENRKGSSAIMKVGARQLGLAGVKMGAWQTG